MKWDNKSDITNKFALCLACENKQFISQSAEMHVTT